MDKIFKNEVVKFFVAKEKYERQVKAFEEKKQNFYKLMQDAFKEKKEDFYEFRALKQEQNADESFETETYIFKVKRVQKKSVSFDISKLKKTLSKESYNQIVNQSLKIINKEKLINHLKSVGASFKVFKDCISSEETVDTKKLNDLGDLGLIELEDLKGCYETKVVSEYFLVDKKKYE